MYVHHETKNNGPITIFFTYNYLKIANYLHQGRKFLNNNKLCTEREVKQQYQNETAMTTGSGSQLSSNGTISW